MEWDLFLQILIIMVFLVILANSFMNNRVKNMIMIENIREERYQKAVTENYRRSREEQGRPRATWENKS